MKRGAVCGLLVVACGAREAAPPVAPSEPAPRAAVEEPAATGARCPYGCSLGEICIRALGRGGAREERCDILPADCASPEVAAARAELGAAHHDYERQKELYEAHAASTADFEAAVDTEKRAKAELARAEQTSVSRCNAACTAAVCGEARCVAAPGVIECLAR